MLSYFTDAVLRGPTIGSMLMCLTAALIGSIVLLRKQSLVGEALSHAAYPGVIFGIIIAGALAFENEILITALITLGAFTTALLGLWSINILEKKLKVRMDSSLCFILSAFFGIGITLASQVQFTHTALYRQSLTYLYGQAATMTDIHIFIYGLLALTASIIIFLLAKELQAITFNREYSKSLGIKVKSIDVIISILTAVAVVIGIRSVGVVLMSAMLITPAAAARQYTHRFNVMLLLAAFIGLISAYFGVYSSVEITSYLAKQYPKARLILPTGPMIVLVASLICFVSLLFAPERGLLLRLIRIKRFQYRSLQENLLKAIWRISPNAPINFDQIAKYQKTSKIFLHIILKQMILKGWLKKSDPNSYSLTDNGSKRAANIIRLHRLWEVYLVKYIGVGPDRVHRNAEEIEHILTPEIEKELTLLLNDPDLDPHFQKIPPRENI